MTYLLVRLGQEQSKTTRAQLRAYLFIGPNEKMPDPEFGANEFAIWLTIRNSGSTPAYKLRSVVTVSIIAPSATPEDKGHLIHGDNFGGALGPGSEMYMRATHPIFTDEQTAALTARTRAVFIHGEIRYRDAFGDAHFTKFRMIMPVEADGIVRGLGTCIEGNEAN